jgi:FkbM family methyltransferase
MDQATMNQWNYTNGKILQFDYDELNENSIVFDIGSYLGDWGNDLHNKYGCTVYMFEPVKEFYNKLKDRFKDNNKIKPFNIGLSSCNKTCDINLLEAASSTQSNINGTRGKETIILRDIAEFIKEEKIRQIHLMKINIEGDEYDLLPRLISSGSIGIVGNIQVQFHDFINDASRKRYEISANLTKTHRRTWNLDFIWENWKVIYDREKMKFNQPNFESNLLKFVK